MDHLPIISSYFNILERTLLLGLSGVSVISSIIFYHRSRVGFLTPILKTYGLGYVISLGLISWLVVTSIFYDLQLRSWEHTSLEPYVDSLPSETVRFTDITDIAISRDFGRTLYTVSYIDTDYAESKVTFTTPIVSRSPDATSYLETKKFNLKIGFLYEKNYYQTKVHLPPQEYKQYEITRKWEGFAWD